MRVRALHYAKRAFSLKCHCFAPNAFYCTPRTRVMHIALWQIMQIRRRSFYLFLTNLLLLWSSFQSGRFTVMIGVEEIMVSRFAAGNEIVREILHKQQAWILWKINPIFALKFQYFTCKIKATKKWLSFMWVHYFYAYEKFNWILRTIQKPQQTL